MVRRAPSIAPGAGICIVQLGGLGDAVEGLPIANAIRDHYPESRITWVCEPLPAPLLRGQAAIDEVIVFERRRGWRGVLDLRRKMRERKFDLTLNLYHLGKSIPPTLLSRAPVRIGLDPARTRDLVWLSCNVHLPAAPRAHRQAQILEFLDFLGVAGEPEWRIAFTEEERREQAAFFEQFGGRPVAALVPASSSASRDWLPERYAAVAAALEARYGYRVMLVGGPGARETALARSITELSHAEIVWAMGDGVRRLAWLLDGSDLVIAPDTGPLHIARALGVPVIGLYGHTNPWRAGPFRKYEDLVVDRYTDPGEARDSGRSAGREGRMERITVEEVLERVARARASEDR